MSWAFLNPFGPSQTLHSTENKCDEKDLSEHLNAIGKIIAIFEAFVKNKENPLEEIPKKTSDHWTKWLSTVRDFHQMTKGAKKDLKGWDLQTTKWLDENGRLYISFRIAKTVAVAIEQRLAVLVPECRRISELEYARFPLLKAIHADLNIVHQNMKSLIQDMDFQRQLAGSKFNEIAQYIQENRPNIFKEQALPPQVPPKESPKILKTQEANEPDFESLSEKELGCIPAATLLNRSTETTKEQLLRGAGSILGGMFRAATTLATEEGRHSLTLKAQELANGLGIKKIYLDSSLPEGMEAQLKEKRLAEIEGTLPIPFPAEIRSQTNRIEQIALKIRFLKERIDTWNIAPRTRFERKILY